MRRHPSSYLVLSLPHGMRSPREGVDCDGHGGGGGGGCCSVMPDAAEPRRSVVLVTVIILMMLLAVHPPIQHAQRKKKEAVATCYAKLTPSLAVPREIEELSKELPRAPVWRDGRLVEK